MLRPGVGRLTARPTAPITLVVAGRVGLAESLRAAPTCRFTDTGIRLPPMTRIAALPPMDVVLEVAVSGLKLSTPAVRVSVPRPSEARPPNALPLPREESGLPQSPLMVMPVPPFGLFQTGIAR